MNAGKTEVTFTCQSIDEADVIARHLNVEFGVYVTVKQDGYLGLYEVVGPDWPFPPLVHARAGQKDRDTGADQEGELHSPAGRHLRDGHDDRRLRAPGGGSDRFADQLRVLGQHAERLAAVVNRVAELATDGGVSIAHQYSPSSRCGCSSVGEGAPGGVEATAPAGRTARGGAQ
ncbi:MAG: hypothetical protein KDB47_13225 [Mycobacterium sp.]|nr:hypothetical protein [Mycobacterium sp.]